MVNHSDRFYLIPFEKHCKYFWQLTKWGDARFKILIRVGAIAVIWSLWLCKNDKVFDSTNYSLMQVIYRCMALLRLCSSLQRLEDRDLFTEVSTWLKDTAKEFINQHGCLHNRMTAHLMT
jgi:hypothetical protein